MTTLLQILSEYSEALLRGLGVTVRLASIVWIVGLAVGTTLGVLSAKHKQVVGIPTATCSFVLSGIPVLVLFFWAHYPVQSLLHVVIHPFLTAAVVLSIINVFGVSNLVSAAVADFPEQYVTAAKVCGLSGKTTVLRIQMPIILRQVVPALISLQIVMLHTTLFASLISVEEVFRVAQRVNSIEYKPIHIYSALALLFLAVSLPVNGLSIWLRKRFTRNISES